MSMKGREVIVELTPYGRAVRVTAMDTKTMTEVIMQGPADASEITLKQNAIKKLEYVLRKKGLIS